jgi:hypothetical protein
MRDDYAMTNYQNARIATAMINLICAPDNDPDMNASAALRSLLIDIDERDIRLIDTPYASILRDCIRALDTQSLSLLRLDESLCPLHACDYAICFDDDDPDCATIRTLFPNHDT